MFRLQFFWTICGEYFVPFLPVILSFKNTQSKRLNRQNFRGSFKIHWVLIWWPVCCLCFLLDLWQVYWVTFAVLSCFGMNRDMLQENLWASSSLFETQGRLIKKDFTFIWVIYKKSWWWAGMTEGTSGVQCVPHKFPVRCWRIRWVPLGCSSRKGQERSFLTSLELGEKREREALCAGFLRNE